ncbi:MAG TPA: PleD family two-component system response regulator [Alphaproteobacteria bacterium]|nr:PleD family two-component system response regulator [Alphaproteobacteria bacterium]
MSARVLVVDDLVPNVKLLAAKLQAEYFDVITALSGVEALEKVAQSPPDLILLDVMMPGMDGFEVCQRLKSDPKTTHIPIVMVTALSDTENRVRGLEAGADDFLTKPVNDIALFARARSLIRLKLTSDQWRLREKTSHQFGMMEEDRPITAEPAGNARVLLVEDGRPVVERIVSTLARDQDEVVVARTAGEAMVRVEDMPGYDLIMVSLLLAEEDGLRLCSQLRSREVSRQIPILLLADEHEMKRVAKGLELGANDYILRPIDRNELAARVRSQIRQKRYQDRLVSNYAASLSMALTDGLTGLFNRRYVMGHLDRLLARSGEAKKHFAVLMFDIDHFKRVNDTYGHAGGDDVLKEFAHRISRHMRNFDLVARIGGEEFLAILPDTDLATARMVAERLRSVVADEPMPCGQDNKVTVTTSIGITIAGDVQEPVDAILKRADAGLYRAKREGRDRVETELRVGSDLMMSASASPGSGDVRSAGARP